MIQIICGMTNNNMTSFTQKSAQFEFNKTKDKKIYGKVIM